MIGGFHNPYRVHSQYGGYTVVLAQKFAKHCIDSLKSARGDNADDSLSIGELRVALMSVEAAYMRANSAYDYRNATDVTLELSEQNERLQRHMYFKYIRENDANESRYLASHAAMSVMKTLHEKTEDLLQMAANSNMPSHLRSVQAEMCWHILELCETGTDVIAEASRENSRIPIQPTPMNSEQDMSKEFDVFISHATEDKVDFVRPLYRALSMKSLTVWFDEQELRLGDNLRQKLDDGLARSRFGVVVLSPSFFRKNWTNYELDGLMARQMDGEQVILPIWHRLTRQEILEQAPSLANVIALNSSTQTVEEMAEEITNRVDGGILQSASPIPRQSLISSQGIGPTFAVFYIAPPHTPELPSNEKPQQSFSWSPQPEGWVSMVLDDDELEYQLDGSKIRLQLDWGNQWQGDEMAAYQLVTQDEPFALTIRPTGAEQIYLPSVVNTSPGRSWMDSPNRSGWMVFEIQ